MRVFSELAPHLSSSGLLLLFRAFECKRRIVENCLRLSPSVTVAWCSPSRWVFLTPLASRPPNTPRPPRRGNPANPKAASPSLTPFTDTVMSAPSSARARHGRAAARATSAIADLRAKAASRRQATTAVCSSLREAKERSASLDFILLGWLLPN